MGGVTRRVLGALLVSAAPLTAQARAPIETDRPDFTESSATIPKGRWQLETGYTVQRAQISPSLPSGGPDGANGVYASLTVQIRRVPLVLSTPAVRTPSGLRWIAASSSADRVAGKRVASNTTLWDFADPLLFK